MNLFIQLVLLLFLTTIIPGKSMMRCLQPLALDRFLISRTWIQRTEEKQSVSRPWFNCLWREEILRGDSYSFLSFCICSSPSTAPPLVIIHFYRLFKNKMHFIFKFPVNGDMNTLWRAGRYHHHHPTSNTTGGVSIPFHLHSEWWRTVALSLRYNWLNESSGIGELFFSFICTRWMWRLRTGYISLSDGWKMVTVKTKGDLMENYSKLEWEICCHVICLLFLEQRRRWWWWCFYCLSMSLVPCNGGRWGDL